MKILVVEDDLIQRRYLQALLTQAGHEVMAATNGEEAWTTLQQYPDLRLVLTDWMMPQLDGPELIRRVRASTNSNYTYLILLTSRDTKKSLLSGLEAGADDYLTKPFDHDELIARLKIGERILNLQACLEDLATHDGLTGLLNRRALYNLLQVEFNRSARAGTPVSVILMDVDHFKAVNDRYGHAIGDQALQLLALTLQHSRRDYDQVGRWGGEEFLVLLPNTDLQEAGAVAERIRANVAAAQLRLPSDKALSIQVSLGAACAPHPQLALLDQLLNQADQALYRAKADGRNCVCLFSPTTTETPAA